MRALKLSAAAFVIATAVWSVGAAVTRTPPNDAMFPKIGAHGASSVPAVDAPLLDRLGEARVSWGDHSGRYTGLRWISGLQDWLWVGPHAGLVTTDRGPEWRWCLWSHLPKGGPGPTPLTITFPAAPGGGLLHGEAAILDSPRDGADVTFEVIAGDKRVAHTLGDVRGENRWQAYELALPDVDAEPTFRLTSANADWRHACFTAFISPAFVSPTAPPRGGPQ